MAVREPCRRIPFGGCPSLIGSSVVKTNPGTAIRSPDRVSAFTLVEILVVVGVIALLVAILLPSLSRARTRARTIKCAANMRSAATGVYYYTQANRDVYPAGGTWAELSSIYIQKSGTGKAFTGPEDFGTGVDRNLEFFTCPDDPVRHQTHNVRQWMGGELVRTNYRISYGLNAFLTNELNNPDVLISEKSGASLSEARRMTSEVANPSEGILLTDAGNDGIHRREEIEWDFDEAEDPSRDLAVLEVHHAGGNNFIYADQHVEFHKVLDKGPPRDGIPAFPRHWIPRNGYRGVSPSSP
jgi:hypothetical protein